MTVAIENINQTEVISNLNEATGNVSTAILEDLSAVAGNVNSTEFIGNLTEAIDNIN